MKFKRISRDKSHSFRKIILHGDCGWKRKIYSMSEIPHSNAISSSALTNQSVSSQSLSLSLILTCFAFSQQFRFFRFLSAFLGMGEEIIHINLHQKLRIN
ncbi:hypothetical protein SSS_10468 [Sarcoptes scabiei]|nr:hypothetical protein SSS_10468 [Sarcoptes scabiei]